MVESRPVAIWVAESAAFACSEEKVFAKKAGTVQESALPSMVVRRNSRRVLSEGSVFIGSFGSGQLIFGCAHHQPDGVEDGRVVQVGLAVEVVAQCFHLLVG